MKHTKFIMLYIWIAYIIVYAILFFNSKSVNQSNIQETTTILTMKTSINRIEEERLLSNNNIETTTVVPETTTIFEDMEKIRQNKKRRLYYYAKNDLGSDYDYSLYLLSHIIYAEVGSDYCTDELQLLTGSVILNRIKSDKFPSTMRDVIYQEGQYQCINNGSFFYEPNDRAIKNAKKLLKHGPIDNKIIFQAEFTQGNNVYKSIPIEVNGSIIKYMYFCY